MNPIDRLLSGQFELLERVAIATDKVGIPVEVYILLRDATSSLFDDLEDVAHLVFSTRCVDDAADGIGMDPFASDHLSDVFFGHFELENARMRSEDLSAVDLVWPVHHCLDDLLYEFPNRQYSDVFSHNKTPENQTTRWLQNLSEGGPKSSPLRKSLRSVYPLQNCRKVPGGSRNSHSEDKQ